MAKKCILANRYLITFLHDLKILFTTNVRPRFLKINKICSLGDVRADWFFSLKSVPVYIAAVTEPDSRARDFDDMRSREVIDYLVQ